jgi:hypothetical protein
MRERIDIEREMFEARQDLEASLDQLIHKAREKLEVRARAEHAVDENRSVLIVAALGIAAVVALYVALRARRI